MKELPLPTMVTVIEILDKINDILKHTAKFERKIPHVPEMTRKRET